MPITIESGPTSGSTRLWLKPAARIPTLAIASGIVEAAARLDQHVKAHQQPERVLTPVIVNNRFMHNQCAPDRKRLVGFGQERLFLFEVPVMENMAHNQDICSGQWILEEIARLEADPVGHALGANIVLEHRLHDGQIVTDAMQMRMSQRQLDRHGALRRPDVGKGAIIPPRKLLGQRVARPKA